MAAKLCSLRRTYCSQLLTRGLWCLWCFSIQLQDSIPTVCMKVNSTHSTIALLEGACLQMQATATYMYICRPLASRDPQSANPYLHHKANISPRSSPPMVTTVTESTKLRGKKTREYGPPSLSRITENPKFPPTRPHKPKSLQISLQTTLSQQSASIAAGAPVTKAEEDIFSPTPHFPKLRPLHYLYS